MAFLSIAFFAIWMGGCSACQVQIWANSDSNDSRDYTLRNPHSVHVGETVNFHILIQPNIASYVVLKCDGEYELPPCVGKGEFAFTKTFDESWRGQNCNLEVRAYKRMGRPDYYEGNKRVLKRQDRDEPPDQEVGFAVMRVACYQSTIRIKVNTTSKKEPDWSKADLEIYGVDDTISHVRWGRNGTDGFTALGCSGGRTWVVFYEPTWDQLCRMGRSKVVFTVPDPSTQETIRKEIWINTP